MIAVDLFSHSDRYSYASRPEADALTERGALQEAALVDVRLDVITSSVGLLFDLRGAIQLRAANVAVLIARALIQFEWENGPPLGVGHVWHAVTGSIPGRQEDHFSLVIGFASDAELRLVARTAEFFVGNMPGMEGAPPDFVEDDDETIRAGMPRWSASFVPLAATFLDPDT